MKIYVLFIINLYSWVFLVSKLAQGISCSHTRGALIWIEVIKQYKLNSPDSCVYKSFPCNDSKSWKYGRCFDCGATNCPMPLLMADSINTPQKGKYYFNTLFDDAESGHYCGKTTQELNNH